MKFAYLILNFRALHNHCISSSLFTKNSDYGDSRSQVKKSNIFYLLSQNLHNFAITLCFSLNDLTPEKCKKVLIQAIANILMKCKDKTYRIVTINKNKGQLAAQEATESYNQESGSSSAGMATTLSQEDDRMKISMENLENIDSMETSSNLNLVVEGCSEQDLNEFTPEQFHERLCIHNIETIDDVEKFYTENFYVLSE